MISRRFFRRWVRLALYLVYLVVLAGATVRMTGSGMGCPDWPKCFGHYVPPTREAQLLWAPGKHFDKGQLIMREGKLFSARCDLQTAEAYNPANWEPYTRYAYATFNAYHTWMEYLNRLIGALSGLVVLLMAILSCFVRGRRTSTLLLSWLAVLLMGLQAWLGATVVYSILLPFKVTLHMLMALVIIALLLLLLARTSPPTPTAADYKLKRCALIAWLALLCQILLGTQLRQFVDTLSGILPNDPAKWLLSPPGFFYVHRSFSILVLAAYAWLFYSAKTRFKVKTGRLALILALLGLEAVIGASMAYLAFPFGTQALHLLLSSIAFGLGYYTWIRPPVPRHAEDPGGLETAEG